MSDELVKRLRTSWDAQRSIMLQTDAWMSERHLAADRIEALTAERDARIDPAEVQALVNAAEPMLATALAAAEAERDRLRAAGEKALCHITGYGEASTARIELRAALKGESHE